MKSSTLRAGVALACALSLSSCGGGGGNLPLQVTIVTGTVTKDGLVLTNNGGDPLTVAANSTVVQFSKLLSTDDEFNVGFSSKPSNADNCYVTNGHARANYYTIQQVSVYCVVHQVNLTVNINNLTGTGLKLVNGTDLETVAPGQTTFPMAKVYQDGTYAVKIAAQPTGQTCTVSGGDSGNGSGTAGASDITSVTVNCTSGT